MKKTIFTLIAGCAVATRLLAATAPTPWAPPAVVDAQQVWKNTAGDTDFNAGTSWVSGIAPGAGDVGAFTAAVVAQPNLSASLSISGLYFKGTGASGYDLTGTSNQTLTLSATSTTIGTETGDTTAVAIGGENTSGTNTIDLPIILAPNTGSTSTIFQGSGGTLTLNGAVSGSGIGIAKTGGGTLVLTGVNTYSGATTISAGTLEASQTAALPGYNSSGTVTVVAGATLAVNVGGTGQWAATDIDTLRSNATFNPGAPLPYSGSALGIDTTVGNFTYDSAVGGGLGLTKLGSNTLTLTGASTYIGATTINSGTLTIDSAGSTTARLNTSAINVNSGGTLLLANSSGTVSNDRINNTTTAAVPVVLTLNGGTFNTGGLSEHGASNNTTGIGPLSLLSTSIIDMASGASVVAFENSNNELRLLTWSGTLKIYGWTGTPNNGGGTDQLYFGNDVTGLAPRQLQQIEFYTGQGIGLYSGPTIILSDGEVVPTGVPGCPPDSFCPDWTARYNGPGNGYDRGVGAVTSPDGTRVYVTGISTGAGSGLDFATVAYDASNGAQLWATRYNGPANANDQPFYFGTGRQIAISKDGATLFVIGLSARADGFNDYVTIAYRSSDGLQLWANRYSSPNDSVGTSLALSNDGQRLYVTGYSALANAAPPAPGASNYDFTTLAYDIATGNQLWIARYEGPALFWDVAYDIGVANVRQPDGSRREQVFVTGRSNGASSDNNDADFATIAYDGLTGAQLWVARYNGPANGRDLAYGLATSPDGALVCVTGESAGNLADYATICYDTVNGAQRWIARYDNGDLDEPLDITFSPSGDRVAVTGFSGDPPVGFPVRSVATIVYDSATGNQVWSGRHSEVDGAAAAQVSFSHDGRRLYVAGLENGNVFVVGPAQAGHAPALTVAYDAANGTEIWATHYSGPAGDEGNFGLVVSPDDAHVFVTGGGQSTAADIATLSYTTGAPAPPPVRLTGVASRKVHGSAGTFDVDLPLTGNPGIECRSGGANGDYTMVFSFSNPLTSVAGARVASGSGSVSSSAIDCDDAHQYVVKLTGVTNAQVITISLAYVYDAAGNGSSSVSASMGVLLGDVNANRLVNSTDTSLVQTQSGQPVTLSNFRMDVNANGLINSTDTSIVQSKSGTGF